MAAAISDRNRESALLRFNPGDSGPATEITLLLVNDAGKRTWMEHPNREVDIAIMNLSKTIMKTRDIGTSEYRFFHAVHTLDLSGARHLGVNEGSDIFVLGFPFGIAGIDRNYVLARNGIVGRIQDAYDGERTDFVIDATIFQGNSGGPVIAKLDDADDWQSRASFQCWLVGVVKSFDPHNTGENAHIAYVEPIDHVREAIRIYRDTGDRGAT